MLIIYWKSDGEIKEIYTSYNSLEETYGERANEYGLIFNCIKVEFDNFVYNNYIDFKIDTKTKELIYLVQFKNKYKTL